MKSVENKTFNGEDVALDDMHYIDCTFIACNFIYTEDVYRLQGCKFRSCQITVRGQAARTAKILQFFGWTPPPTAKIPKSAN
jgi:nitrous oxidase accessory protein NosD